MKFYNEDDLTDENFEAFCREIEKLEEKAMREVKRLCESPKPHFSTIEDVRAYYHSIPFQEWENKMFEKYGIND